MRSLVLSLRRGNRCDVEMLGGSCGRAESRLKSLVRMGVRMKVGGSSGCWCGADFGTPSDFIPHTANFIP